MGVPVEGWEAKTGEPERRPVRISAKRDTGGDTPELAAP
jgi:hypothetical protein